MTAPPTPEQLVRASLMRTAARSAFFATLALYAPLVITDTIPTAATDGQNIYVNPSFLGALAPHEQDGVILHEVLHAALEHVPRRGGREPQLWNIAADIVVNGIIKRHGYALPESAVLDPSREHLAVEEVYELLRREAAPQPSVPQDLLAGPPDGGGTGQNGNTPTEAQVTGRWQQARQEAQVVARGSAAGKVPAGLTRELDALQPGRLDWRAQLWRYLTAVPTDFTGFDRRFVGRGVYLDALAGESARVLVCVDTSGSINTAQVIHFVAEVQGILRAYPQTRCALFYADTALNGPHELHAHGAIPPPVGGGGTDFRPFFQAAARHSYAQDRTLAVYLTDGWGDFPERMPAIPTLWVVTPGGRDASAFPFGNVVRMVEAT